MYIIHLL